MTIQGHSKRKTIIRSSFIFVLVLSILLSSISISFAYNQGGNAVFTSFPYDKTYWDYVDDFYDTYCADSDMYVCVVYYNWTWLSDAPFVEDNYRLYSTEPNANIRVILCNDPYPGSGTYYFSGSQTYTSSVSPTSISNTGITGYYVTDLFTSSFHRTNELGYNSFDMYAAGDAYAINLDLGTYKRDPYSFEAWQVTRGGSEYIECKVNSDLTTWGSYVTIYGQYEYNGDVFPYGQVFGDYEYIYTDYYEDVNDVAWTTFMINPHSMGFENFSITGIEFTGWYPPESRYLYVDWNYGVQGLPQEEYNPPTDSYYYSTFVNQYYSYNESNGRFTSFGFGQIRGSSSNSDKYFWDANKTLIQPYKFSVVAVPIIRTSTLVISDTQLQTYFDVLSKSYDIILLDVPQTTFDYLYGTGAYNDYFNTFAGNGLIDDWSYWYSAHPIQIDVLPYSFVDNPPNYDIAQTVGFLYTDSFYLKSIAYIMGDTDDRLLDLTEKLVGEDGFAQTLFKQMKKTYDLHFTYYDDMIKYMNRLNYVTNQLVYSDFFNKVLTSFGSTNQYLQSLDSNFQTSLIDVNTLLSRINESILGLDLSFENITLQFPEFNFDIIVENHPTTNIEYFVDFVNNFFTAIPDADFSPLENIETDFTDLFDDLHVDDTFDDFLDSLLGDYEFSDSHLSDYD